MSTASKFVPSVQEYIIAFRKIKVDMKEFHRKMLVEHYKAPSHTATATRIGQAAEGDGFQEANLKYGHLGTMVAEAIGLNARGVEVLALMIPPGALTNTEALWIMRPNVAAALEELGWVEKTSHLF